MVRLHRRWKMAAAVAVTVVGLVACGGGDGATEGAAPTTGPAGPAGPPAEGAVPSESAIPAVTVLAVPSGDEFALGSIVPSDRPVLVWFWAPH